MLLNKLNRLLLLLLFIIFSLYFYTSGKYLIPDGDSIEFITAGYCNGIAHSPGYPIFILLLHICILVFSKIFGIVKSAYLLNNILSILCLYILFKIIYLDLSFDESENKKKLFYIGIISILYLSFSRTYWLESITAEVYILNALIFLLLIKYLIKKHNFSNKIIFKISIISAIGLGNHISIIFIIFIIGLKLLFNNWKKLFLYLILTFLFVSIIYIYMMLNSKRNPKLNVNKPNTIKRLYSVITLKQYKGIFNSKLWTSAKIDFIKNNFNNEFDIIFYLFSLAGIFIFTKKQNKYLILTLISYLSSIFIFYKQVSYRAVYETIYVFFIPIYIILVIGFAVSLIELNNKLKNKKINLFLAGIFIILISLNLINNFEYNNFRKLDLFDNYYNDIVNETLVYNSNKSIILTENDNLLYYGFFKDIILKKQKKVKILHLELLKTDWFFDMYPGLKKNIIFYKNKKNIFFYNVSYNYIKKYFNDIKRIGIIYKINYKNKLLKTDYSIKKGNFDFYKKNKFKEAKIILDIYKNTFNYLIKENIKLKKNKRVKYYLDLYKKIK